MRILRKFIAKGANLENDKIYKRISARGIILDGENILLLYTKRYDDYSFPGGGVDDGEDLVEGVIREISEETGATNIEIIKKYGVYDETKPLNRHTSHNKTKYIHDKGYQSINMISYFFICKINKKLGETNLESYEIHNGMVAKWINIYDAISHNKEIIKNQPETIGLYVDRELFMLELVEKELVEKNI